MPRGQTNRQNNFINSFRMPSKNKNQIGTYSTQRKPRNIINSSKRKINILANDSSMRYSNNETNAAISAMMYQTGIQSTK